jgi:hypothetical protein
MACKSPVDTLDSMPQTFPGQEIDILENQRYSDCKRLLSKEDLRCMILEELLRGEANRTSETCVIKHRQPAKVDENLDINLGKHLRTGDYLRFVMEVFFLFIVLPGVILTLLCYEIFVTSGVGIARKVVQWTEGRKAFASFR